MTFDREEYIQSQTLDGWITLSGAARLLDKGYFSARRWILLKWKLDTKRINDQIFVKVEDVEKANNQ